MRALRFHEFGGFERLRVENTPDPVPKEDEVVVRVRAASLNPSDAKNVLGVMEGTTLPRTPGRDFAGVVVDGPSDIIGAEVWGTGGDIGFTRDGTHAELLVVPLAGVRPKPKTLTFEEAAAAGGVGSAVTQIAKWKGARTIGVNRVPMSPERQKEYGIDHALAADSEQGYKSMVDGFMTPRLQL